MFVDIAKIKIKSIKKQSCFRQNKKNYKNVMKSVEI